MYQFAQDQAPDTFEAAGQPRFGCISFSIWDGHRLRLHFHINENTYLGPLSEEKRAARLAELKKMFAIIHR
jgi:hypothetical protein